MAEELVDDELADIVLPLPQPVGLALEALLAAQPPLGYKARRQADAIGAGQRMPLGIGYAAELVGKAWAAWGMGRKRDALARCVEQGQGMRAIAERGHHNICLGEDASGLGIGAGKLVQTYARIGGASADTEHAEHQFACLEPE